ncbi:hypothetical protein FA15DRAFT_272533 [Coprinopsis marcescibilis]|uniref:Uncharacterized protein n=1 Tax=Coprinopsis marcescibilis TaxID=230819 RepID=A0A5C3L0W5_COPMA|nr:hypothetical protein FA15DRAFT_272533 [Coprinopsis marcescibilis]
MCLSMSYTLVLNEPALIFIPPPDNKEDPEWHPPFAMQVTIKQAGDHRLAELIAYFSAQREIVKGIETLIVRQAKGKPVPAFIEIEGEDDQGKPKFVLRGERKPWPLREHAMLMWGQYPIHCCAEKWKFDFELL